ncbi:type IV secretory system conjugative DNA transfer family protein [Dokdonia pacifica]|uniref:Type IV secretion-system coupling protein DNA-binding domain-containing protein n=1 Tax=Dokdonia pacifica TaxID=1627892 RepID=A0A239DYP3_9FLAO|nr:type IV secretion system DNA-binding domain-containing protein [Dokdonia pacifica]SNS37477.1 Type IV secretion-system coupling protein DNA-binding domain-containing protein [Dokdonia pacifica]
MQYLNPYISYFARTDFRDDRRLVGLYQHDRINGAMYLLGRTGSGKSNVMKVLLYQDILQHRGACLMDVSGQLVQEVLEIIPTYRRKDIVLLDATDPNISLGYNPLRKTSKANHALVTSSILDTFKKLWGEQGWGVRVEYLMRNVLLSLQEQPFKVSFADIPKILLDDVYRNKCIGYLENEELIRFWGKEFPKFSKTDTLPALNKVSGFLSIPILRKILVDNTEQVSLRQIMDRQQILLVNVAKGKIGNDGVHLLASLLLGGMASAGFSRIDTPENRRKPFILYLDEFHNYTSDNLIFMISELRKFSIGFVFAHQYVGQLKNSIREAILGNVGTIVAFTLGTDSKIMERIFYPVFAATDFINLPQYHVYIKLLINGRVSQGFSATTLTLQDIGYKKDYL